MLRRPFLAACLAVTAVVVSPVSAQVQVEGQTFPAQVRIGERDLVLNGVGLRAVAWLKGYAAGLYLTSTVASAEGVVAMAGPKRLQMRMLQDVPAAEFVKAVDKGFSRNTPGGLQAALAERREAFDRQILALGSVKKGDVVDLDFVPGSGLVMSVNGRVRGTPVAGEDFYGALLRIFVGEHPVDPKLKAGLLGRRAPP